MTPEEIMHLGFAISMAIAMIGGAFGVLWAGYDLLSHKNSFQAVDEKYRRKHYRCGRCGTVNNID